MVRYDKQHKEATRSRIVESAGRRLKQDGIDGSGVAVLMKDAGLTNGAFYAHFDSKDSLVAEVVASELAAQLDRYDSLPQGREGVEEMIRQYLSVEHRDNPSEGCPSASLLDEIARSTPATRQAYTDGATALVDALTRRLSGDDGSGEPCLQARARAFSAYALMVGTMQFARALTDDELSRAVIAQGLADVLAMLDR
ncbi:TetR/AcrR family transcriptional regulator [Aeromicrobium sp. UC242_57]|uniref:TetR/AcrR family transcriptional regulator n=1 Tax=Aeromicrobium sp. UC242_57 TaxID=3374624 RepID=UPI003787588B